MTTLQQQLAAACERRGVDVLEATCQLCLPGVGVIYESDSCPHEHDILPIPDLLAGLEGWLADHGGSLVMERTHWWGSKPWTAVWDWPSTDTRHIGMETRVGYSTEQEARAQAALAAEQTLEGEG